MLWNECPDRYQRAIFRIWTSVALCLQISVQIINWKLFRSWTLQIPIYDFHRLCFVLCLTGSRTTPIHIKYDFQYWPAPINNSHIAISESTVRQLSSLPLDNYEPLNHHIHNVLSLTDHQTQLYDLLTVEPVLLNPTSYIYTFYNPSPTHYPKSSSHMNI